MTDNFFTNLGQSICRDPTLRQYFRGTIGETLNRHLQPPPGAQDAAFKEKTMTPNMRRILARDQSFSGASGAPVHSRATDQSMPPRGSTSPTNFDQDDPNGNPCTAEECLTFVQMLINGFTDPDEKQQFIEGLSNIVTGSGYGTLQITHMPNGNGRNGNGDRRPAKDGVVGKNAGALDRNRRPAQDAAIRSLNSSNFARRWGSTTTAMSIRFGGNGR
jgi:hypothetical protein